MSEPLIERTIDMIDRGEQIKDALNELEEDYHFRQERLAETPDSYFRRKHMGSRRAEATLRADFISEDEWMPKEGSDEDARMIPLQ